MRIEKEEKENEKVPVSPQNVFKQIMQSWKACISLTSLVFFLFPHFSHNILLCVI